MDTTLATILSGIPLPALLVGQDERIKGMNPGAAQLIGAANLGRHHAIALRQPEVQAALNLAFSKREAGQARHLVPGPSTDSIYRINVTPLPGDLGVLCILEDLSEAEQIGQMRRDFVANVSHELRSPLTALLGFIETLRGPARSDPAAQDRFLTIMQAEAERMNRLIRDLLHLSRVEAEERVRPTERVDLDSCIRSTVETLRPMAQKMGVRVNLSLDPARDITLPGDPDQLVQVFQNLIENAVKYGGAGGHVDVRIERDQLPKGEALRVDVIDHGEGIDPVHIPRLTERFYRVDSHRSREKGGTGLGLAIVKHIIQRHRGRLKIQSVKGKGSTFSVILPLD